MTLFLLQLLLSLLFQAFFLAYTL